MIPRTVAALTLAAIIAACAPTPTPPPPTATPGPIVARLVLPYAGQWRRDGRGVPSLLAYPEPSAVVTATVGSGYP